MSWEKLGNINKSRYLELPRDIYLPENTKLDGDLVRKIVEVYENRKYRYHILQKYYEGWARILAEEAKDEWKADNRLVLQYPSYIVDILLGMFLGRPITYNNQNIELEEVFEDLQAILDYNDEQDHNFQAAKSAAIKGRAYEIMYINKDKHIRFNKVEPEQIVYVWDTNIDSKPLFAFYIRESMTNDLSGLKKDYLVTAYTRNEVVEFIPSVNGFMEEDRLPHAFEEVPVTEFKNNDEGIGDFERVLSLIDAANKMDSNTTNDFEEFTNAILVLYGMLNMDAGDAKQLMDDGVLLLEEVGGKQGAEWLIKQINHEALKDHRERLDDSIHKFSKVPNMSDESFAGNQSGEAQKWKLLAMDQVLTQKQTQMKKALLRRFRLMINYKQTTASKKIDFKYKDIEVIFKDNKPLNEKENVEKVQKLMGMVSDRKALSMLYCVDDPEKELAAIEEERDAYKESFSHLIDEGDTDEED